MRASRDRAPNPLAEESIRSGDLLAIGRLLTLVARGDPPSLAFARRLTPPAGGAPRCVGITGPPGVGKSSLLSELARELRGRGQTVAVLLADPVSRRTGGAFLGDRLRFGKLAQDRGVFIRSLAHRAGPGEPTPGAAAAANVLGAAGYEWVFLETVGIGQIEIAVFEAALVRTLVLSPDVGDWQQMLKAGYLEAADVVVVNKSDRPGAAAWRRELCEVLAASSAGAPRVVAASARTAEGLPALVELLEQLTGRS